MLFISHFGGVGEKKEIFTVGKKYENCELIQFHATIVFCFVNNFFYYHHKERIKLLFIFLSFRFLSLIGIRGEKNVIGVCWVNLLLYLNNSARKRPLPWYCRAREDNSNFSRVQPHRDFEVALDLHYLPCVHHAFYRFEFDLFHYRYRAFYRDPSHSMMTTHVPLMRHCCCCLTSCCYFLSMKKNHYKCVILAFKKIRRGKVLRVSFNDISSSDSLKNLRKIISTLTLNQQVTVKKCMRESSTF